VDYWRRKANKWLKVLFLFARYPAVTKLGAHKILAGDATI
jgi:hypothetical protein